jgi:hypothetical protein
MTEAEWLSCEDPWAMLDTLREKAGDRKLRLFAATAFGRLAGLLPDPRQRRGIELLEQRAEGTVSRAEFNRGTADVRRAIPPDDWVPGSPPADHPHYVALMLYREFCSSSIATHALHASAGLKDQAGERREQIGLMRCIFGNPFRPTRIDPAWMSPGVTALARTIYEERAFDRLHELADALEKAGCHDTDILGHCRQVGPHVRGCWVVDAILGKS